jgi:hypothetical protein
MRSMVAVLFGPFDRPIDRATYVRAGVSLMALKYVVDAALIGVFAGVFWTPADYLLPMISFNAEKVAAFPTALNVALLIWTLPFLCAGVSLSVRRARDARLFPGMVLLFFVPVLNYVMMLALAIVPSRTREEAPSIRDRFAAQHGEEPPIPVSAGLRRSGQMAIIMGAAAGLAAVGAGVMLLRSYGGGLFLGTPFLIGLVSAVVCNRAEEHTAKETLAIGQLALLVTGGALLFFAIEGAVCLAMAVPIAAPIALLGSSIGYVLARRGRPSSLSPFSLLVLLLLGTAIDAAVPAPAARIVTTAIEIDAPPEAVWRQVTSFGDIKSEPGWLFKTGLAYPLRARLEGTGVGAIRHCEFTTGAFVEPITVWDAPRRLAFDVSAQPPPLQEWSPYSRVFAPHLDGFFRTSHGEFQLVALEGGRTRLEGRTWYTLDMEPAMYWTAIADTILHAIHDRVLQHIKREAEVIRTAAADQAHQQEGQEVRSLCCLKGPMPRTCSRSPNVLTKILRKVSS